MQIHELNTFSGKPGETDFLAIDAGFDTAKISATKLIEPKINRPLDEHNNYDNGVAGQLLRTKGDGKTEWSNVGQPTDAQTAQAVTDWLNAHPEATTTVQDGSLTLPKFKNGELPFVTPELYGAVGDGITDDTQAWQDAVDSGFPVKATSDIYKCGTINVTKNIPIDCNNAKFIVTAQYLFKCSGNLDSTLTNQADYKANQANYTIGNGYTGYAMLLGSNNFEPMRPTSYFGGIVGMFQNGVFVSRCPVKIENPDIRLITPIQCEIRNINGVQFSGLHNGFAIKCLYGVNCVFENISTDYECYAVVQIDKSYHCVIRNIYANLPIYTGSESNTYPISAVDSSFNIFDNIYVSTSHWHALSIGGNYVCYENFIINCELYTEKTYALDNHENVISTHVIHTIASGMYLTAGADVKGCVIVSINDTYKNCRLALSYSSVENIANYSVQDVIFRPDPTASNQVGVLLDGAPQGASNLAVFYSNVLLKNIINEVQLPGSGNDLIDFSGASSMPQVSSITVKNIIVDNVNFRINLWKGNIVGIYDFSNMVLTIKNCNTKRNIPTPNYLTITAPDDGDLIIKDCTIAELTGGPPYNLHLQRVKFIGGVTFKVANLLMGNDITTTSRFYFTNTNIVNLCDLYQGANGYLFSKIWRISSSGDCRGTRLMDSFTTQDITF